MKEVAAILHADRGSCSDVEDAGVFKLEPLLEKVPADGDNNASALQQSDVEGQRPSSADAACCEGDTGSSDSSPPHDDADDDDDDDDGAEKEQVQPPDASTFRGGGLLSFRKRSREFLGKHSFLIMVVCAVLLAYIYPPMGAIYLAPRITATWIAVLFIFVLAGMSIDTEEFAVAFRRWKFNLFVQLFNFGVVSSVVYGFSRFMVHVGALDRSMADGMTVCASLPVTVNMVMVLTKRANGDEASAVFHAAFGNLAGVFVSPALIWMYLGKASGDIQLGPVFCKLAMRVILPILVGQLLRLKVTVAKLFVKQYKKYFMKAQELCLIFIVYTVFCKTFAHGVDSSWAQILIMMALQVFMLGIFMLLAWLALKVLFRGEPKLQAMGLFGCTHKTLSMGVPLINAIYEDNPKVGLYTLPLLIWHPVQLMLGSLVAPFIAAYVVKEIELQNMDIVESEENAITSLIQ